MKSPSSESRSRHPERGAVLVIVAIMLLALIGSVALVTDLGVFFMTRNQVQNVGDGSVLAAARVLGNIYQGIPYADQASFVCDEDCAAEIRDTAKVVAAHNRAAGAVMSLRDEDILIGQWDGDTFTETYDQPDAVHVIARRDTVANGPVSTFFAKVLGIQNGNISAPATAALTGQGSSGVGEVELPIGISDWFFDREDDDGFCNTDIQFYPTNDPASCAGWTSWNFGSNDATLRKILDLENENYPSPEIYAWETDLNFTGGTLSNPTFDALLTLFQYMGCDVDVNDEYITVGDNTCVYTATQLQGGIPLMVDDGKGNLVRALYPDGTPRNLHKWETTLPVYHREDCSNPNQQILIVGFAQIELRDVLNSPDKLVRGEVVCHRVDEQDSRGGGGEYGIKGSIPGLVR